MTSDANNPWSDRYIPLLDSDFIKEASRLNPEPVDDLHFLNVELACSRLKNTLEATFYPTKQCVNILQRLAGVAYAYAVDAYPSSHEFISRIYSVDKEDPVASRPICLTGLAGIGKSEILKAFKRIAGQEIYVEIDRHHPPFQIRGVPLLTLKTHNSPNVIAKSLLNVDVTASTFPKVCSKRAYRDGIPFFMIDEAQFVTASTTANARITQILLSLSYIGLPYIYCANYSLYRRLERRLEEDRQRLLSDVIVLTPDAWSSDCWKYTLESLIEVAPKILKFDADKDARKIFAWTAGRKRALVALILIAYRIQHANGMHVVDSNALEAAYRSSEFTEYRKDSEALANQATLNQHNNQRKDLWCPIPNPAEALLAEASKVEREDLVAEIELKSALTQSERDAVQEIESLLNNENKNNGIKPTPKPGKQSGKDLLENARKFKESLGL
ncbi:MAG: hypothetical protein CTY38_04795 [Methylotenera sp.]|uniref:hypothetical protein n=1 Tax=Methylotenera sp. TaxID=2051956 RepID=UPI000D4BE596|nr:hypothetical protein [Methylotenera sp.]PPC83155.1 MAG: hypothetical protein CTY38_04795 [Methylotenera sp.]